MLAGRLPDAAEALAGSRIAQRPLRLVRPAMSKHSAKSDEDWGTDKVKPATKQAEKAMYDADEALMEHRTTSLLGIPYKLEFIAHEEIKEDADDQVG